MLDPRIVANAVLDRADAKSLRITNLDLQKIVYFLHGAFLKAHGRPLVTGEFEAWPYGPVHKVLYESFKLYNDAPVDGRAQKFDPIRRRHHPLPRLDDADALDLLNSVLDKYLQIPTFMLVRITHDDGTPWKRTLDAAQLRANVGMRIGNDLIQQHFEGPYLSNVVQQDA